MKVLGYKAYGDSINWYDASSTVYGINCKPARHDFEGEVINIVEVVHPPCEHKTITTHPKGFQCTDCNKVVEAVGWKAVE
jgi:hypothetical protein